MCYAAATPLPPLPHLQKRPARPHSVTLRSIAQVLRALISIYWAGDTTQLSLITRVLSSVKRRPGPSPYTISVAVADLLIPALLCYCESIVHKDAAREKV